MGQMVFIILGQIGIYNNGLIVPIILGHNRNLQ